MCADDCDGVRVSNIVHPTHDANGFSNCQVESGEIMCLGNSVSHRVQLVLDDGF